MFFTEETNGNGSIDRRIADALATDETSRTSLTSLREEAEVEIGLTQKVIEVETERALDLSNPDPDKSDVLIAKAKRSIARLEKAVPQLTAKIEAIEAAEYAKAWDAEYKQLFDEEVQLAADLARLYKPFVQKLIEVFARIDYHKARGNIFNRRAPRGEFRRIQDAEIAARGIGH